MSVASKEFSTNSLTLWYSALAGFEKPTNSGFLLKNSAGERLLNFSLVAADNIITGFPYLLHGSPNKDEASMGKRRVASALTNTLLALGFTLFQDIASRGLAPLRLPSNS